MAPAGTPPAIKRMRDAVAAALQEPAAASQSVAQGLYPSGNAPDELARQIATEIEKMIKVSVFAKVSLD